MSHPEHSRIEDELRRAGDVVLLLGWTVHPDASPVVLHQVIAAAERLESLPARRRTHDDPR